MPQLQHRVLNEFFKQSPEDVFSALQGLPHSVFLSSANYHATDENNLAHNRRFDLLLWSPVATITETAEHIVINYQNHHEMATDYWQACQQLQQQFLQDVHIPDSLEQLGLPFLVGLAGYNSYDQGLHLLPHMPRPNYQFNTPLACHGLYLHSLIYDHQTGQYHYIYLSGHAHTLPEVKLTNASFSLDKPFVAAKSEQWYLNNIAKVHEYLLAGDCYQINFAQHFYSEYKGCEYQAFRLLLQHNKAPYSAFIRNPNGVILSLSPERFIQVKQQWIETKPIKGTAPRSGDAREDRWLADTLQHSEKNRAENLMILDLLRNDLSKHCQANTLTVPELFAIESYPAVHHLVSTVRAKLAADSSPLELYGDAFPGGSITGAPKIRAMQIIHELEQQDRHIFCGSIGYWGVQGDMDTNICIRTLLCEDNHIYTWAGGGIVMDSEAHAEYQETLDKLSKIIPVLEQTCW